MGVVIGGAAGIGAATVRRLARDGAHVIVADVADEAGHELCGPLHAEYQHCDATRPEEVGAFFARVAASHSRLHFAVNVVGGSAQPDGCGTAFHEQTDAAWDATIDLTLRTALVCLKHEIASMLPAGGGSIVSVGSMAALHVTINATPAYSAAKAALTHLSRYLAVAYGRDGIRVNVVAPGLTATPKAVAALGQSAIDEELSRTNALPRAARADDPAAAIAFLCSDDAAMITGHTIPVDGGWHAR